MDLYEMFLCFLLPLILLQFLFRILQSRGLPPGPIPVPIIGSLLKLGDKPHRSMAELAKIHGPIMSLKLGQLTTIVVSSPSMAQEILQKHDIIFSNRFVNDALRACDDHKFSVVLLPPNDHWKSLRKLAHSHIFSARKLDSNHHIRRAKVEELLTHVGKCCHQGVAVNLGSVAFQTSLNVLSNTFFSIDLAEFDTTKVQDFKELVWNIMVEAGKPNLVDYFPALAAFDPQMIRHRMTLHFSRMMDLFGEIIDKKLAMETFLKDSSEHDVIDAFLKIFQNNAQEISRKQMQHICLDLFTAGTDTTSSTLEWAMTELLRHPMVMKNAKEELGRVIGIGKQVDELNILKLPYLNAIIKETLRIHPPAPFLIPRQACTKVDLCGYTIPKGAQVLVNVWAIGRDHDYWKNPLEFIPERFLDSNIDFRGQNFELIPFGSGRRICLGLSLAMRILPTMLGSLINSFDWKIDGEVKPENLNINEKFGLTLQRADPLLAIPIPI